MLARFFIPSPPLYKSPVFLLPQQLIVQKFSVNYFFHFSNGMKMRFSSEVEEHSRYSYITVPRSLFKSDRYHITDLISTY